MGVGVGVGVGERMRVWVCITFVGVAWIAGGVGVPPPLYGLLPPFCGAWLRVGARLVLGLVASRLVDVGSSGVCSAPRICSENRPAIAQGRLTRYTPRPRCEICPEATTGPFPVPFEPPPPPPTSSSLRRCATKGLPRDNVAATPSRISTGRPAASRAWM